MILYIRSLFPFNATLIELGSIYFQVFEFYLVKKHLFSPCFFFILETYMDGLLPHLLQQCI